MALPVHTLAAVCLFLLGSAGSLGEHCETGGACLADEEEQEEQSMLMITSHAHENFTERAGVDLPPFLGGCNEAMYAGLCYKTCTDMGEMEPRTSVWGCGPKYSINLAQHCTTKKGESGSFGIVPGSNGRPKNGCLGDASRSYPSKEAPTMCTQDCGSQPTLSVPGLPTYCCSDKKSTPKLTRGKNKTICSCPLGKKNIFGKNLESALTTTDKKPCNTGCSKNYLWLMKDGVAYCCGRNKPKVFVKTRFFDEYKVTCECS